MVIKYGRLTVAAGAEDLAATAIAQAVPLIREEKGSIVYSANQSQNDPTVFIFYEEWTNEEAYAGHGETAHMANLRAQINGIVQSRELHTLTPLTANHE